MSCQVLKERKTLEGSPEFGILHYHLLAGPSSVFSGSESNDSLLNVGGGSRTGGGEWIVLNARLTMETCSVGRLLKGGW